MVADISGFTALTEALSRRGAEGIELLTRCMNRYFTAVSSTCSLGRGPAVGVPGGVCGQRQRMPHLQISALPAQVIELLLLYGGDVVKFAGDSMIVAFLPTPEEQQQEELADAAGAQAAMTAAAVVGQTGADASSTAPPGQARLRAATRRALTCAAELVERFGEDASDACAPDLSTHCKTAPLD